MGKFRFFINSCGKVSIISFFYQLVSQTSTKSESGLFMAGEAVLTHGNSKAENRDLIRCWSHLQDNSFLGTYQKKNVLDYASWNNTSLSRALTIEIDCLETLWGQKKIKAFLKEWLKIFTAILWWCLFSAAMGCSCTCLCEERKTRMKGCFLYHYSLAPSHYTIPEAGSAKAVFFWILLVWREPR